MGNRALRMESFRNHTSLFRLFKRIYGRILILAVVQVRDTGQIWYFLEAPAPRWNVLACEQ